MSTTVEDVVQVYVRALHTGSRPVLPVILGAVAVSTAGIANALSLQRHQLEAQSREARDLLAASEERERLLQTVLDTVSVGVCALDAQGRISLMNHHLSSHLGKTITGTPTPEEHKELPVFGADRKHPLPADRPPASRAARGETFTDELIWSGKGTAQRAYSATSRLVRDSRGGHRGGVLAFTDVTELVEALSTKDRSSPASPMSSGVR
ncbi:PAS domain-containing protein [Pseudarthrobacter phenanthrenivorans]|uniref:PAS domain-containing protein n=1 Tax=Pseudarthrobacter phenanthrenivorans TaxID=361575 RepID=UPI002F35F4A1